MEPSGLSDAHFVTPLPEEPYNDTSASHNDTEPIESLEFERYVRIIVPSIFTFICVLGVFGNLLVIIVVLKDKHMRNTTNILILSLAVADLLFLIFCVPFTAIGYAMTVLPFGAFASVVCKVSTYLMYVCAYASVYTLVIMSLDRYLAVAHAIRSMTWRSERNTWLAVAIIWFITLCGNIPIFLQWGVHYYKWVGKESRSACIQLSEMSDPNSAKTFFGCFLLFGYIIPLGVTMLLYGLMLKRLLYGVAPGGANQSAESIRAKKRVTRMVIIVVVIFGICWLPIQIVLFWQKLGFYPSNVTNVSIMMAANCLAYMNSCINPILYAFLSSNFRRSFRKFLCCSETPRRLEYERTNIRCTVTEKESNVTKTTCVNNSKTYTAV